MRAGADAEQFGVSAGGVCRRGERSWSVLSQAGRDPGGRPRPTRALPWSPCRATQEVQCWLQLLILTSFHLVCVLWFFCHLLEPEEKLFIFCFCSGMFMWSTVLMGQVWTLPS